MKKLLFNYFAESSTSLSPTIKLALSEPVSPTIKLDFEESSQPNQTVDALSDSAFWNTVLAYIKSNNIFANTLTQAQQDLLDDMTCTQDRSSTSLAYFTEGFKIGMLVGLESVGHRI